MNEVSISAMHLPLVIGGVAAILGGVWKYGSDKKRLRTWTVTEGLIDNIRRDQRGDAVVLVRYFDSSNTQYSAWLPVADGDSVGLGMALSVAYDPLNPTLAMVAEAKNMNWTAFFAITGGVVMLFLGIFNLRIPR